MLASWEQQVAVLVNQRTLPPRIRRFKMFTGGNKNAPTGPDGKAQVGRRCCLVSPCPCGPQPSQRAAHSQHERTTDSPPALLHPQVLSPLLPRGHPVDMHLFISEKRDWRTAASADEPVWVASNLALGEPGVTRGGSYIYHPSPAVQNNGSVWVHAVFTPAGASPSPNSEQGQMLLQLLRYNRCCWWRAVWLCEPLAVAWTVDAQVLGDWLGESGDGPTKPQPTVKLCSAPLHTRLQTSFSTAPPRLGAPPSSTCT